MEKRLKRGAGILLPISSLPSPYGIGTCGKAAYEFVDKLKKAGQTYWQVLPIGPTSYGDSPYQSFSTFAGNPYFIDLDMLVEEGILEKEDVQAVCWGGAEDSIDYGTIYENRFQILKKAFYNTKECGSRKYKKFVSDNREWLEDYSLFMSCKEHFNQREWLLWDKDIMAREPQALKHYSDILKDNIMFWKYIQFKFYSQWDRLKKYANDNGIKIIGDIPIYVALDSSDVWAAPGQYQLDENLKPVDVAGCPPDIFSDYGQKWGNPLYNWDVMEKDGFTWWKRRMASAARMYDVIRIDHFIGIAKYYAIPADGTPSEGEYRPGPAKKLTDAIDEAIVNAQIIAEDLGVAMPEAKKLLQETGYPGMKVLEFAFDGHCSNEYLPHNYNKNCVVYTGTHDNDTLAGYLDTLGSKEHRYLQAYTGCMEKEVSAASVIRLAYGSVADTAIIQMQDILLKDNTARMNLPSTIGKNWRWRLKEGEFGEKEIEELFNLADVYSRLPEIVYRVRWFEENKAEKCRKPRRKEKGKRTPKGKRKPVQRKPLHRGAS